MLRSVWPVVACLLAVAAPARADDIRLKPWTDGEQAERQKKLYDHLRGQKVELDRKAVRGWTLLDGLAHLSKKHGVAVAVMEEPFKARGVANIKDQTSALADPDPTGLTLDRFLGAWLAGFGAAYTVEPNFVRVVPLAQLDAPKPAPKVDPVERLLAALDAEANFANVNVNEVPMFELVDLIGKKSGLSVAINEEAFRQSGIENFRDAKPRVDVAQFRGLTLRQSLNLILESLDATYLIRNGAVEVVPLRYAAKVTRSAIDSDEGGTGRLREPLVSAVVREKPLNEALAALAERFDLTIVVAPQAADARTGFVTARLLNVPADKAVELLALQCDLRVVRKGTSFLVTSKDHAEGLFNERQDRERQKIELEKLREAPAAPPKPPEKPAP